MTIPEPWNDKNKSFIYTSPEISALLTDEQINKILSINTNYTTYIRSNLAITNGSNSCIPNVFEAINITYSLVKTLSSSIQTINSEIANIKEQIEELKPKQ